MAPALIITAPVERASMTAAPRCQQELCTTDTEKKVAARDPGWSVVCALCCCCGDVSVISTIVVLVMLAMACGLPAIACEKGKGATIMV